MPSGTINDLATLDFITKLLENTISFKRQFIDFILCGTQEKNIHGLLGKKNNSGFF